MELKKCRNCGESKPKDKDHFYYRKDRNTYEARCIECIRKQQNQKYANDPAYRDDLLAKKRTPEVREKENRRRRERYDTDPEYRESISAAKRTPEYRERQNQRQNERYQNDPAYREDKKARSRAPKARDRKNQLRRERYHSDEGYRRQILEEQGTPEARARQNQRERERRFNDPYWKERENARLRERYHNDHEYRQKLHDRQSKPEVRERNNRARKDRYHDDPAYRQGILDTSKDRYHNDPEFRERHDNQVLLQLYGITTEQRQKMEVEQNSLCAICGLHRELFIDHNHETGQVRGLLCPGCNIGIGQFQENPQRMLTAAEYLAQPAMDAEDIPRLPDQDIFARFDIPNWEKQSRDQQFRKQKNLNLKQLYGISIDQYEWLLAKGNGVCYICCRPETLKKVAKAKYLDALHVDHDHHSGAIRGLLCGTCNRGIGAFEDDRQRIIAAVTYLRHRNQ